MKNPKVSFPEHTLMKTDYLFFPLSRHQLWKLIENKTKTKLLEKTSMTYFSFSANFFSSNKERMQNDIFQIYQKIGWKLKTYKLVLDFLILQSKSSQFIACNKNCSFKKYWWKNHWWNWKKSKLFYKTWLFYLLDTTFRGMCLMKHSTYHPSGIMCRGSNPRSLS